MHILLTGCNEWLGKGFLLIPNTYTKSSILFLGKSKVIVNYKCITCQQKLNSM